MGLISSREEIKKIVEDYDPTEEEYKDAYEEVEYSIGKVTATYEDRVVMLVTYTSGNKETRYFSTKIPFICSLKKGQEIQITTYYNYDIYTEMYDLLEEKMEEKVEIKSKEITKDLVCEC